MISFLTIIINSTHIYKIRGGTDDAFKEKKFFFWHKILFKLENVVKFIRQLKAGCFWFVSMKFLWSQIKWNAIEEALQEHNWIGWNRKHFLRFLIEGFEWDFFNRIQHGEFKLSWRTNFFKVMGGLGVKRRSLYRLY